MKFHQLTPLPESGLLLTFPLNGLTYLALWVISNFLTTFLRDAPYLQPYLPQIPTFFVLFAIII